MSCGSKACTSIELTLHLETVQQPSWLWRVWRMLGAMIDGSRRRQLWLELEKARQRGLLYHLDDRLLEDIGLTREQAEREACKPIWK